MKQEATLNRRKEAAALLCEGYSIVEIAKKLGVDRRTIYRDIEWYYEHIKSHT